MDGSVVLYELLYGLPFIMTGLLVWRMRSKNALSYCSSSLDESQILRFLPRPFLSESRSIQLVSRVLCNS